MENDHDREPGSVTESGGDSSELVNGTHVFRGQGLDLDFALIGARHERVWVEPQLVADPSGAACHPTAQACQFRSLRHRRATGCVVPSAAGARSSEMAHSLERPGWSSISTRFS